MQKLIILFGAPGSGKGLLGDRLIAKTDMVKISTGDIFRAAIKKQTDLGTKVADYVAHGKLVDDLTVNTVVFNAIAATNQDIILDGYPRNLAQFHSLCRFLQDKFYTICIYLDASTSAIMDRIKERRICESCGTTHFAHEGCCPKCGGRSILRDDDKLFAQRMSDYQTTTATLLEDLYAWCKETIVLNAMDIEESTKEALKLLGY